jgi:anti-anti-sigma factor
MVFQLSLISRDDDGVTVVGACGDATAADFPSTNQIHFDVLLGSEWASHFILMDMEHVPYIDSSAIGWLMAAQRECRAAGGMLALHSLQPSVRNVLEMLKVDRLVPLATTPQAGRKHFKRTPAIIH